MEALQEPVVLLMGDGSDESGDSVLTVVWVWVTWGSSWWPVELSGTAEAAVADTSFPHCHLPQSGCLGNRAKADVSTPEVLWLCGHGMRGANFCPVCWAVNCSCGAGRCPALPFRVTWVMWGWGQGPLSMGSRCVVAHLLGQALPVPPCHQALLPAGTKPKEGLGSPSHGAAPGRLWAPLQNVGLWVLSFWAEKVFPLVQMSSLVRWGPELHLWNRLYWATK